jgi:hypothetical protein
MPVQYQPCHENVSGLILVIIRCPIGGSKYTTLQKQFYAGKYCIAKAHPSFLDAMITGAYAL